MNPANEYLYTEEVREKSKVRIFFIHEKCENVTLIGERSHLSWKIGLLHIFFIIFVNPAKEYLYTGEVRKKSKVD